MFLGSHDLPAIRQNLQEVMERLVGLVRGALLDDVLEKTVFACIHLDHTSEIRFT